MLAHRIGVATGLSLLFLTVYGGTNWLSAWRTGVPAMFFEWERGIPFVPWMIVPYMAIDIFFLLAPFLCRDRDAVAVFARRIVFATTIGGLCFLTCPLRFSFERPHTAGWLGALFDGFRKLDQPFNQFPSLHVTFAAIVGGVYFARARGAWRALVIAGFGTIVLSTVFTYQHHVIDLVGGGLLAAVAFGVVNRAADARLASRLRVAGYFATGALLAGALAAGGWPAAAVWIWTSVALSVVSLAYLGLGPRVFGKVGGRVPALTRLLLLPVLAGHELSWAHYRRRVIPWSPITPAVWFGRALSDAEAAGLVAKGVRSVVDLTAEADEALPFRDVDFLSLPVLDLTAPTPEQIDAAVRFIREHQERGIVYVHCKVGYSRSAVIVGAYLLASGIARTASEAVTLLERARPGIVVRPEARAALAAYA